jgi:hypothetical protein
MFSELKSLLASCHVKKDDPTFKIMADAEPRYLIQRAKEELALACNETDFEAADKRMKLSIVLTNLARYKLRCNLLSPKQQLGTAPKPKSNKQSSTNSNSTTGTSK